MVSVIIVAAGESKRFKGHLPKPYFNLGGKPIVIQTLLIFSSLSLINEIILVVHRQEERRMQKLLSDFAVKINKLVVGGEHRQNSVDSGLKEISSGAEIVLIHDGVRPLIKPELIELVINEVKISSAVVPAVSCEDTIKKAEGGIVLKTLKRRSLRAAQTPQGFKKEVILSAYQRAESAHYYGSDDAELVERLGHPVKIIPGDKENIKITTSLDLVIAEAILNHRLQDSVNL